MNHSKTNCEGVYAVVARNHHDGEFYCQEW